MRAIEECGDARQNTRSKCKASKFLRQAPKSRPTHSRSWLAAMAALLATAFLCDFSSALDFDLTRYHDYPDFEAFVRTAELEYPSLARVRVIGTSREGRKLLGLKIGAPSFSSEKPAVWIDGGNHAREWPAFHLAVYFIQKLLTGYGNDAIITAYLDRLNFYIFPVLNPDGFIFSRTSKRDIIRQWRKNRAPANCSGWTTYKRTGVCCEGVDLNRNWDVAFSHANYPFNNPCSDEFQGPAPFSEPESRAVRDFVLSREIADNVHAMISMHTHGQFFILPFNYRRKTYPPDFADLFVVAQRAAAAIESVHETKYRVGTAADMLGPATGGATDWIKLNTPIKYVYVIELPPELRTWFAFQMKPHWLTPTARETWEGVRVIVEQVLHEFAAPAAVAASRQRVAESAAGVMGLMGPRQSRSPPDNNQTIVDRTSRAQ